MSAAVPDRGQIVLLEFASERGREIGKRRPALVLSPKAYNRATGFALVCPITSQVRGGPFEVALATRKTAGVVLADRLTSLDWRARNASVVERVDEALVDEVRQRLLPILG
jgi:mRNA interferase MazF